MRTVVTTMLFSASLLCGQQISGTITGVVKDSQQASVASAKISLNNQEQGTIPGYALYNAGVGYTTRVMAKRVAFQVNLDNLANKRYWNGVQTGTYGIGMDRSVKFNVRVDL